VARRWRRPAGGPAGPGTCGHLAAGATSDSESRAQSRLGLFGSLKHPPYSHSAWQFRISHLITLDYLKLVLNIVNVLNSCHPLIDKGMGRPRATSSNREFAVAFVNSVTVFSARQFDWVARKGRHGLFELMLLLAPKVTTAQLGPLSGRHEAANNSTRICR
jgi:hypothetical protein